MEPLEWAKQYAAKRSAEERASKKDIIIKYSSSSRIEKGSRRSVNIGYLFLKDIYYDLGIDSICAEISEQYQFEFDLNQILSMLIFISVKDGEGERYAVGIHEQAHLYNRVGPVLLGVTILPEIILLLNLEVIVGTVVIEDPFSAIHYLLGVLVKL